MKRMIPLLLATFLGALLLAATQPGESSGQEPEPTPVEIELETFVPSEKLPADSAVAFPVDI